MRRKFHARCGAGEKPEVKRLKFLIPEVYLSLFGEIPEFKEKLATMRKYEISCTVICQDITQLKGMYPEDFETVDANCPQTIFLGGDGNTNNEYVSKKLGTMTVKGLNSSIDSKRVNSSYGTDTRELMKADELGRMPFTDEIIMIYGEQPIYDKKYDYPAHRNYQYTFDYAEDCGVEASMFNRNLPEFQISGNRKIIIEVEIPKCVSDIKPFDLDACCRIFAANDPDDIEDKVSTAWNMGTTSYA